MLSAASLAAMAAAFLRRSSITACVSGADWTVVSGWKDGAWPSIGTTAPTSFCWKGVTAGANRGGGGGRAGASGCDCGCGLWNDAGVNAGACRGALTGGRWDMARRRRYASSPVSGCGATCEGAMTGLLPRIDESSW